MTGREMEARSGVPRAKNGCREYSEEDLALPERIKLLRRPGGSAEALRALLPALDGGEPFMPRRGGRGGLPGHRLEGLPDHRYGLYDPGEGV